MKHYHVIVNPQSGSKKGIEIFDSVKPFLKINNCTYEKTITSKHGDALAIAQNINLRNIDAFIIVGGDGTVHEVINGMLQRSDGLDVPIGIIPAGTGNSLMHHLSLQSIDKSLEAIIGGKSIDMDIYEMHCSAGIVYFFNVFAWGIPAYVNIIAERLRIFRGWRYNAAAILGICRNRTNKISIDIGNERLEGEYSFIAGCNTVYTGNGMKMAPEANISDGLIDVLIVKKVSRSMLMVLFNKIFSGSHLTHSEIKYFKVSSFKINTLDHQPTILDGEIVGHTPCLIQLSTKKIKIFA